MLGALLGVAVGDALGAPLEFMSAEEIQAEHGGDVREMLGGGWLNTVPGEVTDDTQMTLAVAEGIAESPLDPIPAIGRRFIKWYDSGPKDIGNACRAAIAYAKAAGAGTLAEWHKAARRVYEETGGLTAGNGALMRTIYVPLWYGPEQGCQAAEAIGLMTHAHGDSTLAVLAYTRAVADIVAGAAAGEVAAGEAAAGAVAAEADAAGEAAAGEAATETAWGKARIEYHMKRVRESMAGRALRPDGYALNSLMCAIDAIRDTGTFEEAIVRAVNLGGDADTIGAVTGGLAGALYGANAIPRRWKEALDRETVRQIRRLAAKAAAS